jgi:tRNA pseudouridine55 synthase
MTPGIHLVHKPVGPTSFSIVQQCIASLGDQRGKVRTRLCHGGTLDPFAHGLLLILVGQATKLFDHLHAVPKVYEATIRWGIDTDNGDPLGRVTFEGDASSLTPERLDESLPTFTGWREQVPPATSAKRVGGERAYEKAHRGEPVALPPSRVYLHEATWLRHDLPRESTLRIVVRGGYYVRSLARDLGRSLGCGAHLTALHRTAIGPWTDPGLTARVELHGRDLLPWAPSRDLTDHEVGELRQARTIAAGELVAPEWRVPEGFPDADPPVRGFHREKLVFLLRRDNGGLRAMSELARGL